MAAVRDLKTGKYRSSSIIPINHFENIGPKESYWIGFLLADGNVDGKNKIQLCLSKKDREHLFKFKNFVAPNINVNIYCDRVHCQITNKQIVENLIPFGFIPKKSKNIIQIPSLYHRDFIRGIFDGDGWISKGKGFNKEYNKYYPRYCFGICSYRLGTLKNIDRFLPVKTYITKKKNQHLYELRVNRLSDIKKLFEWLYMGTDEEIRLNRKFDKFYEIYNG